MANNNQHLYRENMKTMVNDVQFLVAGSWDVNLGVPDTIMNEL